MGKVGSFTDTAVVGQDKRASAARWLAIAGNPLLHVAILCSLPLLLLLMNRQWIYNPAGFIDTWIYVGFFEHYDLPQYFVGQKKIMRLPWIWTGFAIYRLFPPLIANYVVHLSTLLGPSIAIYFLLRKYFAVWIAFFVAVSLVLYVPFHGPGGWDYHDAFAGLFYVLTVWCVSNAATRTNRIQWLLLAGAAWSICVHANVIFVHWTPLLILHFVALGGVPRGVQAWRLAIAWLAGLIAMTLILCLGNYLDGRDFFFHWILIQRAFDLIVDPAKEVWWRPWSSLWFLGREGLPLALLTALFIPACWLAVARWRRLCESNAKADTLAVAFQFEFVLPAIMLLLWQTAGQPSLQPWYMAEPLLYSAMLALAGQLHVASRGRDYLGLFALLVVPAAFLVMLGGSKALDIEEWLSVVAPYISASYLGLVGFALYGTAIACLYLRPARFGGFASFALLLAFANAVHIARAGSYITLPGGASGYLADVYGYPAPCELREDIYRTTIQANQYLAALKLTPAAIKVFWDDSENFGLLDKESCWIRSRYLAIPIANTGFTTVSDAAAPTADDVLQPQRIAVLAGDAAHRQAVIERINRISKQAANVTWLPVDEKHFDTPVLKTSITLLKPHSEFMEQAGATHLGSLFKNLATSGPVRLSVPAKPWYYGEVYPSAKPDLKGPLWVQVAARFTGGPFGIGVLSANNRDFSVRRRVDPDPEVQHITLIVPENAALGDLVFQSWVEGNAGDVEIESVDVVVPRPAVGH